MLSLVTASLVVVGAAAPPPQLADTTMGDVGGAPRSMVYSGRLGQLDVVAPHLQDPAIKVDGRLDEAEWQRAAILTGFTQYEPVEGIPATEDTEVLVFYTSDAIYFGIRALDREPNLILARMGERDRAIFGDDWIRLMLDTFDDQRQAYIFYVNPLGIQSDALWIEGMQNRSGRPPLDFNPDFIWESEGRVTAEGWVAEIKLPYLSLRFRETPLQNWGINIAREVKRRGFKQSWAPLTQNNSSTLAQSGTLVGLRDLKPRKLVEINPVGTGKRTGQVDDGQFARDGFQQDFGLNARYGVTQNLVLDATVNPDFSQVEADVNQISINERFALFFPEKRPFFLEGTEIFRTPRNLVHTRQIADPAGGAKLTGKIGSFNVGYLGAVDESPKTLASEDHSAVFNLLRLRRDVGAGSTLGLLYTDRSLLGGGGYNRVAAADARLLLNGRYTLTTQVAGSWTTSEEGEGATLRPLLLASFERSGRSVGWQLKVDDVHPEFRTRTGFIPRVGDTEVFASVRGTGFGAPGSVLERLNAEVQVDAFFDHDEFWRGGSPFEAEVQVMPTFFFKGDRSVTVILRDGLFRFREEDYASYEVLGTDGQATPFVLPDDLNHLKAIALIPRARITNEIQLNGRLFYREIPIFREAARGLELQIAPDITVRPTTALQLSLSHTFSRIWRQRDDSEFSKVNISRLRTQYQFSKSLFARVIVQYDLERRSGLRDPRTELPLLVDGTPSDTSSEGRFEGQFLISYEPSPGTILFLGYSRLMEGDRSYRLARMDLVQDGLFLKVSYLFRL